MTDYAGQIPTWAWVAAFSLGLVIISGLGGILIWFLRRFLDDNKESWKEIKEAVGNLVNITTKHELKIFELEKDYNKMEAKVYDKPFVEHHPRKR